MIQPTRRFPIIKRSFAVAEMLAADGIAVPAAEDPAAAAAAAGAAASSSRAD